MIDKNNLLLAALEQGDLIVPDRVAAAELRMLYARHATARGDSTWRSPRIETLEGLLRRLISEQAEQQGLALRLLSNSEEWILWQSATEDLTSELEGDSLLPLNADRIAESLWQAARLIHDWGIPVDAAGGDALESRWLQSAMRAVEDQASKLGALPRHRWIPWLDRQHRLTTSFSEPRVLVDDLPRGFRRVMNRLESGLPQPVDMAALPLTTPQICVARDPEQEWRRAAQWVRHRLSESPESTLLIVIPRLGTLRERVERVFREELTPNAVASGVDEMPVEIVSPISLGQRPFIRTALDSLSILLSPRLDGDALSRWWCDPFWGAKSSSCRAQLARQFRLKPLFTFTASRWREAVEAALPSLDHEGARDCLRRLRAADQVVHQCGQPSLRTPGAWGELFSELLEAIGFPEEQSTATSTLSHKDRIAWQSLLEEFSELGSVVGQCDVRRALKALRNLADRKSLDMPIGHGAIRLTANLRSIRGYEGIWVTGLRADTWPASPQTHPYVSRLALSEAGMREGDAVGQIQQAQDDLRNWRASTPELWLSWAVSEDESLYLPSPLLTPWLPMLPATQDAAREWLKLADEPLPSLAELMARQRPPLEGYSDEVGTAWPSELKLPGGAQALIEQDRCPFSAYARRRLQSGDGEEPALGIDGKLRGHLLHRGFEILWATIESQDRLRSMSIVDLQGIIEQSLQQIDFAELESQTGIALSARLQARELIRLSQIMQQATALERDRPTEFRVLHREEKIELTLGGASLSMRIDRVDQLADGRWLVIDYKSGDTPAPKWFGDEFDAIQLWLYAEAARGRVSGELAGLAHLKLRSGVVRFQGLTEGAGVLPNAKAVDDLGSVQQDVHERLVGLAQGFLHGKAHVEPRRGACERCDLPILCRKADWALSGLSVESEAPDAFEDDR